jgi:hypothetical protein
MWPSPPLSFAALLLFLSQPQPAGRSDMYCLFFISSGAPRWRDRLHPDTFTDSIPMDAPVREGERSSVTRVLSNGRIFRKRC